MVVLSIAQKVALGLALPTAALLVYLLWRSTDDDEGVDSESFVTSRQTVIEVKVPRPVVGAVIGRQGCVIKQVAQETGARIHFRDRDGDNDEEGPDRIVLIRGNMESAQNAELKIRKIIAEQPDVVVEEIHVPQRMLGKIIGRGGENIRQMMRISKCRINISRSGGDRGPNTLTPVELKGSQEQIETAKALIDEKIAEADNDRARDAVIMANRRERGRPRGDAQPVKEASLYAPDQVRMPDHGDYIEVYVSAMEHPGQFWLQLLTTSSARLDRLVDTMTTFYDDPESIQYAKVIHFNEGDIVAAPFPYDSSWYRARITKTPEGDDIDLFYVDYGDTGTVHKEKIRQIRSDFLSLPFQAVEVCLDNVTSRDEQWSEESLDLFEEITAPGKWKTLMARTKSFKGTKNGSIPCVELVDTNGSEDVYIAQKLVDLGFGVFDEPAKSADTSTVVENGDTGGATEEVETSTVDFSTAESHRHAFRDEGRYKDRLIVQQVMDFGRLEIDT
ncbi:tudor and KH domain-containing protein-like isoform X2 [Lineus longissimus]|uniref:tudor and KH domain-containing protein-like isoform X2 n=1 Tax=Lineus longissimus TaxID=88925 RepID=UPI002B4EC7D8